MDEPRRFVSLTSTQTVPPIPSGKQRWRFGGGAVVAEAVVFVLALLFPLCCCVSVSEVGEMLAVLKEEGGELLKPVKPNALSAEKRPLLPRPVPKLVRRGVCDRSAFATG